MFFTINVQCYAQAEIKGLFSLDLSYSITGLLNQGWGMGVSYERRIFDYLSLKGTFGHMTFLTGIEDMYCTSVSLSLFANYYPFGDGLDKLYISIGNGCDFINYFGKGELPANAEDTLIYLTPGIGWKFNLLKFLMIDVSTGYKFIVSDTENYKEIKNYLDAGVQFSFRVKILLNRLKKE